jgi:hypothetical protein
VARPVQVDAPGRAPQLGAPARVEPAPRATRDGVEHPALGAWDTTPPRWVSYRFLWSHRRFVHRTGRELTLPHLPHRPIHTVWLVRAQPPLGLPPRAQPVPLVADVTQLAPFTGLWRVPSASTLAYFQYAQYLLGDPVPSLPLQDGASKVLGAQRRPSDA